MPDNTERVFHFHEKTLHTLKELVAAAGLRHPNELKPHHIIRRVNGAQVKTMSAIYTYLQPGDLLDGRDDSGGKSTIHEVFNTYWPLAKAGSFKLTTESTNE